ncbi:hypothetical protein GCM10009565_72050 [Amycolatopsis albidoflavus]
MDDAGKTRPARELLASLPGYSEPRAVGRGWHTYDLPSRIPLPNTNRRPEDHNPRRCSYGPSQPLRRGNNFSEFPRSIAARRPSPKG